MRSETRNPASTAVFYLVGAFTSLLVGFYLSAFVHVASTTGQDLKTLLHGFGVEGYVRAFLVALVVFALILCADRFRPAVRWLVKYRFAISALFLVVCCALEISGSSIAVWARFLGLDGSGGTLFGVPRPIRSDEWMVATPDAVRRGFICNVFRSRSSRSSSMFHDSHISPASAFAER